MNICLVIYNSLDFLFPLVVVVFSTFLVSLITLLNSPVCMCINLRDFSSLFSSFLCTYVKQGFVGFKSSFVIEYLGYSINSSFWFVLLIFETVGFHSLLELTSVLFYCVMDVSLLLFQLFSRSSYIRSTITLSYNFYDSLLDLMIC